MCLYAGRLREQRSAKRLAGRVHRGVVQVSSDARELASHRGDANPGFLALVRPSRRPLQSDRFVLLNLDRAPSLAFVGVQRIDQ